MPLKIEIQKQGNYFAYTLKNNNDCYAQILSFGAILNKYGFINENNNLNVIDAYEDSIEAELQKNTWFKSCKLNPFSCRLQNGEYSWQNKSYKIDKFYLEKHAIHGLIYDAVFTNINSISTNDFAQVTLQNDYKSNYQGYPFFYEILVTYTLNNKNELSINTKITNKTAIEIPMADGWHPYFKLDCEIVESKISFNSINKVLFDNELIPIGKMIAENNYNKPTPLANLNFDDCFELKKNSIINLIGKNYQLTITPIKNYPFLQVFIPNHKQNIAIENLSAIPNCFNNKIGLNILQPKESIDYEVVYCIEKI